MKNSHLLLAVAASLATLTCAVAADLSHSDKKFFEKAAKGGMAEVDISQAVLPKLTDPSAQQFAQMMITDHTQANNELKDLAMKKGVTLPADDGKETEKWQKKNDKDINEDYLKTMVKDHKETVDLFEDAAKSKDPEIAAFASKTLPTLRHHLEMAQGEKKTVKN